MEALLEVMEVPLGTPELAIMALALMAMALEALGEELELGMDLAQEPGEILQSLEAGATDPFMEVGEEQEFFN